MPLRPNTGTYVSATGHGLLILWALAGGLFLRENDPLPLQSTEVSLLSGEEFAALTAPPTAPDVPSEAPEVVAPETEESDPAPAPAPEPPPQTAEPAPTPPPTPEAAPEEPQPEPAPVTEAPDEAPVLPEPPAEQPSTAETVNPDADAQPAPAPRVAPDAAEKPEPDAEVAETVTPEVTPDEAADVEAEEQPATAPEEATTEIVTEAEKPSAPTTSQRPRSRPKPPAVVAEAPAPAPETPTPPATEAVDDAVAAALADAAESTAAPSTNTSTAPSGPPLTGGEKDALRVAVQQCWNVGSLSTDALQTTVVVSVSMTPDAKPEAGSIRMLSFEGGSQAAAGQAFEAARRAIIRCGASGYNLPVDKYGQWQNIEMTFNPEKMRIK